MHGSHHSSLGREKKHPAALLRVGLFWPHRCCHVCVGVVHNFAWVVTHNSRPVNCTAPLSVLASPICAVTQKNRPNRQRSLVGFGGKDARPFLGVHGPFLRPETIGVLLWQARRCCERQHLRRFFSSWRRKAQQHYYYWHIGRKATKNLELCHRAVAPHLVSKRKRRRRGWGSAWHDDTGARRLSESHERRRRCPAF